jgi:prepilin-type N-terminal cleavage/methylation domain-containing protein
MTAPGTASTRIPSSGERGFTLLELMISMVLLAVMMAMTYSAFSTAMGAVPRGEDAADRAGRLRMATSLLTRQVRSLVNYPAYTEDEVHPYFNTDAKYCPEGAVSCFSFITGAPQLNGGEGLAWVTYWTDGATLWMAERAIFSVQAISGDAPDPTAQTVLFSGLRGANFQYLRLEGTDSEWVNAWDPMEEQALPGAIRITLDGIGNSGSYWIQEIPIMTVVYGLGNYDPEMDLDSFPRPDDLEDGGDDGGGTTAVGGGIDDDGEF